MHVSTAVTFLINLGARRAKRVQGNIRFLMKSDLSSALTPLLALFWSCCNLVVTFVTIVVTLLSLCCHLVLTSLSLCCRLGVAFLSPSCHIVALFLVLFWSCCNLVVTLLSLCCHLAVALLSPCCRLVTLLSPCCRLADVTTLCGVSPACRLGQAQGHLYLCISGVKL